MIVYANGKTLANDVEGNAQFIGINGTEQNELKINDHEQETMMSEALKELKKINLHLSMLSDESITNNDVGS